MFLQPAAAAVQQDGPDGPENPTEQRIREWLDPVTERLAVLRDKPFARPVDARAIDRDGLRAFLTGALEDELPPEKEAATEAALEAFGLVPRGFDLRGTLLSFLTAQVGGFYDPKTDQLFCIEQGLSFLNRVVMVHETVHALQDQHADLDAYLREVMDHDDRGYARQAVVEGEAQYVTDRFLVVHGDVLAATDGNAADDPKDVLKFGLTQLLSTAGAPPYLVAMMTFPYLQGAVFIGAVREAGGWAAVDALYEDPPLSTEQVLHPEKFVDPAQRDDPRDVVAPDLLPLLPEGFRELARNTLGEVQTELFVRLSGDPVRALRASYGWDGDEYRVYGDAAGGRMLLQWVAVFDSDKDAQEMMDALRKVLELRFAPGASDADPPGVVLSRDQATLDATLAGVPLAAARRAGDRVTFLLGLAGKTAVGKRAGAADEALPPGVEPPSPGLAGLDVEAMLARE